MATIDNAWNSGVVYTSGIDLGAKKPLDSRISVNTIEERDAHITGNRAYEGMLVYVTATEKTYILKNGEWKELIDETSVIDDLITNDATHPLSAAQGKILKEQIDAAVSGTGVESANKLTNARTISLTGDASGSVSFNGTQDVDIEVTIADDSHNHIISNVDGLQDALDLKAPLASPALTGTPTAPTAAANTNTTQIATTAFVQQEISDKIAAADAMIYKGTLGTGGTVTALPTSGVRTGWTYKVITAGTYAGVVCEVGDMVICLTESPSITWTVVQSNIDGAVTGPASATADRVAIFNGTTGKVIKDSGLAISANVGSYTIGADVTDSVHGLMTPTQKDKLDGIAEGAEVNQSAFSNVKVGTTTIASNAKTDTVEIASSNGITVTADATSKKVTITGTNATQSANGMMSSTDKIRLDKLPANPTTVNAGTYLNVDASGNYILKKVAIADVVDLTTTLSGKVDRVQGTAGNIMKFGTNGTIVDTGISANNLVLNGNTVTINCTLD